MRKTNTNVHFRLHACTMQGEAFVQGEVKLETEST